MTFSDKAAITGIGETNFVKGTERTAVDMMLEASRRAIADAGLCPSDIDGMVPPPIYTTSEELAANLGIDRTVEGFHARVVQHECDHLWGKLYPMRIRDFSRFGYIDVLFPDLKDN